MASRQPVTVRTYVGVVLLTIMSSQLTTGLLIASPPSQCGPLDVLFVVDHSGSISDNNEGPLPNWSYIIQLMTSVVSTVYSTSPGARFAAVSFGDQAAVEFNFDAFSTASETSKALGAIVNSGGSTNTTGAVQLSRIAVFGSTANRPQVPDVCVIITDGVPSRLFGADQLMAEVNQIKQMGVRVIGVGVTTAVNTSLMLDLVSTPATDYFDVLQFDQLPSLINSLASCITTTTSPPPTSTTTSRTSTTTTTTSTQPASTSTTTTPTTTTPLPSSTSTTTTTSTAAPTSTSTTTTTTPPSTSTTTTTTTKTTTTTTPPTSTTSTAAPTSTSTTTTTTTPPSTSTTTSTTTPPSTTTPTTTARIPSSTSTSTSTTSTTTTTPTSTSTSTTITTPTTTKTSTTTRPIVPSTSTTTTTAPPTTTTTTPFRSQPTTLPPAYCSNGFDLVILLDASGGLGGNQQQFTAVTNYLSDLVARLNTTSGGLVRVGLVQFADSVRVVFTLQTFISNTSGMVSAIQQSTVLVGGGTNTSGAIQYVRQNMFTSSVGGRANFPDVLLLVTYGPSQNTMQTQYQAYLARASGILVTALTVGSGSSSFDAEINAIVSYPSSSTRLSVQTFSQLDASLRNATVSLLCNNADNCAAGPCTGSANCVDGYGTYSCQCQSPNSGANCSQICRRPADIVFVIDVSITFSQYTSYYTNFLRQVLPQLNTNSRVGLLTYSTSPTIVFQLPDFPTPAAAANVLSVWPLPTTSGQGDTANAISTATNSMMLAYNRTNVDRFIVVVTNGFSTSDSAAATAAAAARAAGIYVIVVGVTTAVSPSLNPTVLNALASDPITTTVLTASQSVTLDRDSVTISTLVGLFCQNSGYGCDTNPCRNGGACTNQPGANFVCSCSNQFTGPTCQLQCSSFIDLVYVIDASAMARFERFPSFQTFVNNVNAQLQIAPDKTRVALITYSTQANVSFFLNTYTTSRDLYVATQAATYIGGPSVPSQAIRALYQFMYLPQYGGRPNAQHTAVFVTTGVPDADATQLSQEIVNANNFGIQIIVVGVGLDINVRQLAGLASYPPDSNFFLAPYASSLQVLASSVAAATCVTNYCANSPCQNGATCINMNGYYSCNCQPWYAGLQCDRYCNRTLDIAIVLDMSNGMDTSADMLELTRGLINGLPIGPNMVRVAFVTYSDSVAINFNFSSFSTKAQMLNALVINYPPGGTNTAAALQTLYQTVFTPAAGARSNARHIAVFITGGMSDDPTATQVEAANARSAGIIIYGVAYDTPIAFMGELSGIDNSNSPLQTLSSSASLSAADVVASNELNSICNS